MYKPRKQSEVTHRGRLKVSTLNKAPELKDVRNLFVEAEKTRGCLCEISIQDVANNLAFVLTCRYDQGVSEPIWSLFQGEDGSKTIWTYPTSNYEMIYDITCMSLTEITGGTSASQPASNASQTNSNQNLWRNPTSNTNVNWGAGSQTGGSPPAQWEQTQAPAQPMPQAPVPQAPIPSQMPQPNNLQGQMPLQTPQWNQPQIQGQAQVQLPPQPVPQAQPIQQAQTADPSSTFGHGMPLDLIDKRSSNIMLGELLVEAGIIPDPYIDSALKLQELFTRGILSREETIDALRKAMENQGVLDDKFATLARRTNDPREIAKRVLELIRQAGLITEQDIETASKVRAKHGGDVGLILVSAGKIEKLTIDSAKVCLPYIETGRIKKEQAIMALHYCQRTRTSLEAAFKELQIDLMP